MIVLMLFRSLYAVVKNGRSSTRKLKQNWQLLHVDFLSEKIKFKSNLKVKSANNKFPHVKRKIERASHWEFECDI